MAKIIRVNGQTEGVEPKNGKYFTLKELQKIVGGYVELVHLSNDLVIGVNEDGRMMRLPHNELASRMTAGQVIGDIVGDMLVCHSTQIV